MVSIHRILLPKSDEHGTALVFPQSVSLTLPKALTDTARISIAVNQGSIVNAIQSCCCNIQSSIDKCCCQTNLNIERSTNGLSRELGGAIRDLSGQIANQTVMINDKFCALELREKQNQIDALRARLLEQSQDAQTKLILNAIENQKMVYNGVIDGTLFSGTGTVS